MAVTMLGDRAVSAGAARRSPTDVVLDQLRGIDEWTRDHRAVSELQESVRSREATLDRARRREAVARQRQALVEWTARQLLESDTLLRALPAPRAVVVHRSDWFQAALAKELAARDITVTAVLENGADAVGVVIAEQPDVLVVEDKLPMITGLDVTRAARRYAPRTTVIAQVGDERGLSPFFDAGATTVYARRTPPADIAAHLGTYLAG